MTLPFVANDGRTYVCFVCGVGFKEYPEYKQHIIEEHEEGREYVICPLERCKAPVRDVRLHFKAKHPNEKLPKMGQMKAILWTDQRSINKKRKKPSFKEGYIVSVKNNGKQMHYRSGYEKEVYECLELMNEVAGYSVESVKVEYFFNGKVRNYYPDLLVHFRDGKNEIWEIKPSNQTTLPMNVAKWDSCKGYCFARGWNFQVVTETYIATLKNTVRQRILFERQKNEDNL